MHRVKVRVVEDALDANNTIASANRADFDREGVTVLNLMSAPGAGKTTLLVKALPGLEGVRPGVLEGDVAGSLDADRLADVHIPVTQLNTDQGFGGECHLDANMVRSALPSLPLADLDLLVIENVGNLVCPAEFRVGEDARVMVSSVTEGEDKPLKYPLMFRACELVIINKIDLLEHVDFDLEKFLYHLEGVHPGVPHMLVSARTGEGLEAVREYLVRLATQGGRPGVRSGRGDRRTGRGAPRGAHGGQPPLLRRRGRPDRPPLPPDGRALRARRPAGGARRVAGGALGRPPRRGRVRASGDRRQARAARRSGSRARAGRSPRRSRCWSRPTTSCWPSRPTRRRAPRSRRPPSAAASRSACRSSGRRRAPDPFVRQELTETLYHLLWELVHVFFEHRGLLEGRDARRVHDAGASSFLYPFLGEQETDLEAVIADVAASVTMKADEVGALREQTLLEGREVLHAAAAELRARLDAGGTLLALGNGGSATDAMDVVADFRAPPPRARLAARGARST